MPSARQPAAALRDRAERHVFDRLPELPAVERRVLALVELAGIDRADAGRELGIEGEALAVALAAARKALRRTRAALAAGARCEQGERLLSDRLDVGLDRPDRKWLEIHLARCPRCIEHEQLLGEARVELRAAFEAAPPALSPAPETRAPGVARLRVVPAAEAEPAAEAQSVAPAVVAAGPQAGEPRPVRNETRRGDGERSARRADHRRVAKVVAIILVVAGLIAAAGAGLSALDDNDHPAAPWTQQGAPDVKPAPLSEQ
jgi:hypothetical protein